MWSMEVMNIMIITMLIIGIKILSMKFIYIIMILLFISCNNANQSNKVFKDKRIDKKPVSVNENLIDKGKENVLLEQKEKSPFLVSNTVKRYSFNELPLSKLSINDNLKYVVNSNLKERILEANFYYNLIYYNEVLKTDNFTAFTVIGSYDYRKDVLLITTSNKSDSLIDLNVIASIIGDAGETEEVSTLFLDSTTFKVTTQEKRITEDNEFKTISDYSKIFKITPSGKIE